MGARERGQQTILGKQFERAHVQFAITAQGIAQSTLGLGKRRRIEDDQIVLLLSLFRRSQEQGNLEALVIAKSSFAAKFFVKLSVLYICPVPITP
jgi:hypothetical protein